MIPILAAMLAGAGVGALKYFADDKPKYEANKRLAATQWRTSPWTGLRPDNPQQPSLLGDIAGGAGLGGNMGNSIMKAQAGSKDADALNKLTEGGGNAPAAAVSADAGADMAGGTPIAKIDDPAVAGQRATFGLKGDFPAQGKIPENIWKALRDGNLTA